LLKLMLVRNPIIVAMIWNIKMMLICRKLMVICKKLWRIMLTLITTLKVLTWAPMRIMLILQLCRPSLTKMTMLICLTTFLMKMHKLKKSANWHQPIMLANKMLKLNQLKPVH
jgi:hypothetical protein